MTDTEREALCARIDELCQEVEALKRERAYRELGKCLQCSNVDALLKSQADNAELRELACGAANEADRLTHDAAALQIENAKLRELLQRLRKEYQYIRMRPRQMYLQHEQRMRSIEDEMRELGVVK